MLQMKNLSVIAALVFLVAAIAVAQEVPVAEVYGGYSLVRVNTGTQVNAFNANGGIGAFQYNVNKNFAIVAEFGGTANGHVSVHSPGIDADQTQFSYLFGPRISVNKTGRVAPFVEFLFGGVHNSRSFSIPTALVPAGTTIPRGITVEPGSSGYTKLRSTQNAFAMAMGGGLDVKVTKVIAVRPIQLDYLPTHFSPFNFSIADLSLNARNDVRWQNNLRYSAGVTFRFGGQSH
jgi:opacity protein-like surface antigen